MNFLQYSYVNDYMFEIGIFPFMKTNSLSQITSKMLFFQNKIVNNILISIENNYYVNY